MGKNGSPPAPFKRLWGLSLIHIYSVTEAMKNDIAVAQHLGITATTLEGILTVKGQGRR